VFLRIVSLGELFYGVRNSNRLQDNIARVEQFAASIIVLDCDLETARSYGTLKAGHRFRRMTSGLQLAHQYDLALVTRDQHFSAIPNLRRERW
jgi:predicted nucleic acid-binding protein